MIIQLFKNNKGIIYGADEHRIVGNVEGTLKIGSKSIDIVPGEEAIFPSLGNGTYVALFFTKDDKIYELEPIVVRYGSIVHPSKESLEKMEFHKRLDELESACEELNEKVRELSTIFDTNSLNFLIK